MKGLKENSLAMKIFLLLIFTLCAVRNSSITAVAGIEISYEDIKNLNASCHPRDSCHEARFGDSPGIAAQYSCSCDRLCSKLGTCCIDSPHRNTLSPKLKPKCRSVDETDTDQGFYMVDRCELGGKFNPIWEKLCEEEWKGEDNLMKIAPVTSLFSSMTYKNYFCFRCHEATHEYLFWDVVLRSQHDGSFVVSENGDLGITYDHENETWVAQGGEGASIPVKLGFNIPCNIESLALGCKPNLISNCSDSWTDENTRDACSAYTALMYINRNGEVLEYKNVHCAVCNFESLENMQCSIAVITVYSRKQTFSFIHLMDINRPDAERAGKMKKCEENFVWDPYGQKCRKVACAIPGYIVKDGQCAPP